jgi:hypothetical protein
VTVLTASSHRTFCRPAHGGNSTRKNSQYVVNNKVLLNTRIYFFFSFFLFLFFRARTHSKIIVSFSIIQFGSSTTLTLMESAQRTNVDLLHRGLVPVLVSFSEVDVSKESLDLQITLETHQLRRILRFQLTSDRLPFFFFVLRIGEEEFPKLKREQNLHVDFSSFGDNVVDLFRRCEECQEEDHPTYVLYPLACYLLLRTAEGQKT